MSFSGLTLKILLMGFALSLALAAGGCASKPQPKFIVKPVARNTDPILTPDYSLAAQVVSVNLAGRFVVLSFPAGPLPKVDQPLFLYRAALKVAELRVTGPQSENHTIADIVSGTAQVGDSVRDQ